MKILVAARAQKGFRRWIPWLAAFSRARLDELCQLLKSDIRQEGDVVYMDLNEEQADKHLNTPSIRKVPLHQALIEEGFLEFVASKSDGRLFDELEADRFGRYAPMAGKKLVPWVRKSVGIKDTRVAPNHSFRHRFKDMCRNSRISKEVCDAFTGHTAGDVASRYGDGFTLAFLSEELARIPVPEGLLAKSVDQ